jgi:hypothetical protein
MSLWQPTIARPFTPADLEGIFRDALCVLEEVGVESTHEPTARRLIDATAPCVKRSWSRLRPGSSVVLDCQSKVATGKTGPNVTPPADGNGSQSEGAGRPKAYPNSPPTCVTNAKDGHHYFPFA